MNNFSTRITDIKKKINEINNFIVINYKLEEDLPEKKEVKNNESSYNFCKPLQDIKFRESQINKKNITNCVVNKLDECNLEEITSFLNEEAKNVYFRNWNKLEPGLKINRINIFIQDLSKEYNLNEKTVLKATEVIMDAFKKNKLNKKSEVIYDDEKGMIKEIKFFEISQDSDEYNFIFNYPKRKVKNVIKEQEKGVLEKIKRLNMSDQKKIQKAYSAQNEILGITK